MTGKNTNIISQLKKDILLLQGFKHISAGNDINIGWGQIDDAFPNKTFPLGAVHEFLCSGSENGASSSGFMAGLLAHLMKNKGVTAWISSARTLFPPALKSFGIEPDRIIFVDLEKERDGTWAMEEALKCGALTAVVGEIRDLNFTVSRRLQLAVEESQVTGFILRPNPRNLNTTACVSRWMITPIPSETEDNLPGIGFPRWKVELLKVRNGKPGSWQVEWRNDKFRHVSPIAAIFHKQQKKTG
ncbi:MAG: Error-prone repair protein ImuA [Chitinophagaceae bacterium]